MARMRNPFFSNCSMMSPTAFLRTASGLTMVKVRCKVFISSVVCPCSLVVSPFRETEVKLGLFCPTTAGAQALDVHSNGRGQGLADGCGRFCHTNSGRFERLHFFA